MSRESVQFVEMVRGAAANMQIGKKAKEQISNERLHFCWNCGQETWHRCEDRGTLDEALICIVCGVEKYYRVR